MWILQNLKATNIQTIKELDYTLTQGVTVLLFGENNDNPTQKSNGSGKSAILEIISLATRGTPIRPVRIDEMVNNDESKATAEATYFNEDTGVSMTISRELFKKSTNTVKLYMEKDGIPLPENDYIQSSSSEYNRFIFDQLGITEDEFMNNFLLSKHRYTSFFDSSDRDKKEIINNLSNATMIDPSMSKVEDDISDAVSILNSFDMQISSNLGATEAIEEQIRVARESEENNPKASRIKKIEDAMTIAQSELLDKEEILSNTQTTGFNIAEVAKVLEDIVYDGSEVEWRKKIKEAAYTTDNPDAIALDEMFRRELDALDKNNREDTESLEKKQKELAQYKEILDRHESTSLDVKKEKEALEDRIDEVNKEFSDSSEEVNASLLEANKKLSNLNEYYLEIQSEIATFAKRESSLRNILAGVIKCPACSHEFLLGEGINLDDAKRELDEVEDARKEKEKLASKTETDKEESLKNKGKFDKQLSKLEKEKLDTVNNIMIDMYNLDKEISDLNKAMREANSTIADIERAVSTIAVRMSKASSVLKDNLYDEIDRVIKKNSRQEKTLKDSISFLTSQIDTYKDNIKKIDESDVDTLILNLTDSKAKLLEEKERLDEEKTKAQLKHDELVNQLNVFKSFKTHLANSKIEALAYEINYFLDKVGTDVKVELTGYTKNKSGKVSDKIYTSIIRDGVDFGSLYKLSEGEKATIHLATILARQKLINSSTDVSKGLNFLCIDEILDSIDYGGLARIFTTLNSYGITSIIISHGNILETYPHRLKVRKTDGISELVE